jgi:subtilisin family serine protease
MIFVSIRPAAAQLDKLDPVARVALERLRNGRLVEGVPGSGAARELDVFIRGAATRAQLEAAGARVRTALPGWCTAYVPEAAIEAVSRLPGIVRIQGAVRCEPELDVSVPASGVGALRGPGPDFEGLNGAGVLIGDVDSGVDFDHGDFKNAAGSSRIVRIWDQTDYGGPPPASYAYGTEWSAADLDDHLAREVDQIGHGTHVLGIAGGDGSQTGGGVPAFTYAGMAPQADLVMVKTDFLTTSIVDGVKYCFDLAGSRGESAVVNLSLGTQYGPHDGTSDFESALSALTGPGRIIVKSAGNDRGVPRHAEIGNAVRDSVTLTVAGSRSGRLFAIDGYYESDDNLALQIVTPNGTVVGPIPRGGVSSFYPGTVTLNGYVYLENGLLTSGGGDPEVYLEVNVQNGFTQNMNGTWTITSIPISGGVGDIDLWLYFSSSGLGAGFVRGNAPYQELVTEPGNAEGIITAGAYVTKAIWPGCNGLFATYGYTTGSLASFSSPGPSRDGRMKPDITAPGSAIGSTNTFDLTSVCPAPPSGTVLLSDDMNHIIFQGTSMSAPHVAGAAALLMQASGAMTPAQIKARLAAQAIVDGSTGSVPNKDWGAGKLHLDNTTGTQVTRFEAAAIETGIELRWRLADRFSGAEVSVERAEAEEGPWNTVRAERRAEDGITIALDRGVRPGATYWYRLRGDGGVTLGSLVQSAGGRNNSFDLADVAPNPSAGVTDIDFSVGRETRVRLDVVDVQGRVVAILVDGVKKAGRYGVKWNGAGAPPGLYFVRYRTAAGERDRRVALVR